MEVRQGVRARVLVRCLGARRRSHTRLDGPGQDTIGSQGTVADNDILPGLTAGQGRGQVELRPADHPPRRPRLQGCLVDPRRLGGDRSDLLLAPPFGGHAVLFYPRAWPAFLAFRVCRRPRDFADGPKPVTSSVYPRLAASSRTSRGSSRPSGRPPSARCAAPDRRSPSARRMAAAARPGVSGAAARRTIVRRGASCLPAGIPERLRPSCSPFSPGNRERPRGADSWEAARAGAVRAL